MKKFYLALLAMAAALAITPAALADAFGYTFTAGSLTATGTLTGYLVAPGEYEITSGTITITGGGAEQGSGGVLLQNTSGPGGTTNFNAGGGTILTFDDLLFVGSNPEVNGAGLLFELNGVGLNLWGNGPNSYTLFEGNYLSSADGTFITYTPEPTSLLLLGTGLLGLAFVAFRRAKSSGQTLSVS